MPSDKEPVLLTILVDTSRMRWLAAGIGLDGSTSPLLVSHDDDFSEYRDLDFDEQTSFLRHRFCGVLQRGTDRLWGLTKKAAHFVFVMDQCFPHASQELTDRVSEHLVQWMTKPPVTFYRVKSGSFTDQPDNMTLQAGSLPEECLAPLKTGLLALAGQINQSELWELVPQRQPRTTS